MEQLQRLAEHAAGGIDFLDGQQRAAVGRGAEGGFLAGERGEFADADGVAGGTAGTGTTGAGRDQCKAGNHAGQQGIADVFHGGAIPSLRRADDGPSIDWRAAKSSHGWPAQEVGPTSFYG